MIEMTEAYLIGSPGSKRTRRRRLRSVDMAEDAVFERALVKMENCDEPEATRLKLGQIPIYLWCVALLLSSRVDAVEDELKRALRTAKRSLEEASVTVLMEDAHKNISDALHQLTFVLERLVEERSDSRVTERVRF